MRLNLTANALDFHILGGSPTRLGEFPHMVALGYEPDDGDGDYRFDCGGTLIADRWILTAAHCLARNEPVIVRAGKVYLHSDDDDADGLTMRIDRIVRHPAYRSNRNYDDIALIRLAEAIAPSATVRPACLRFDPDDLDAAIELFVTGWGSIDNGSRSEVLLKATQKSVALAACNRLLLGYSAIPNRRFPAGLNAGHICAYDPDGVRSSCAGDSGGPLQMRMTNDVSSVVGVVSFGASCGSTLPSVFVRVAHYVDWIESIVWPN